MCRGRSTYRSTSSRPSPKAASAVRRADSRARFSSRGERTTAIPFPPPPAEGLTMTGNRAGSGRAGSISGTTGTPAALTRALAAILSPIASMAAAGGPMKTRPAAAAARANAAFSDRKP